MTFYKSAELLRLFGAAAAGDRTAAETLRRIEVPFAASPDWSQMILVQMKSSTIDAAGRVRVLNMPPASQGRAQQGLDIYTRSPNGAACSSITLPSAFLVHAVAYRDGSFVLETADGRSVVGTVAQILQGMRPVQFAPEGVTEQQLESSFNSIPGQVPPQPKPRKTAAENPPIHVESVGTFVFDERLQWFTAEHPGRTALARLHIKTADSDEATELIEVARRLIQDLSATDRRCKDFAAQRLLDLKNRAWREAGEGALMEGQFTALISLESVSIDPLRRATAYYDDGGMFGGHTVVVELDTKRVPVTAELAG